MKAIDIFSPTLVGREGESIISLGGARTFNAAIFKTTGKFRGHGLGEIKQSLRDSWGQNITLRLNYIRWDINHDAYKVQSN